MNHFCSIPKDFVNLWFSSFMLTKFNLRFKQKLEMGYKNNFWFTKQDNVDPILLNFKVININSLTEFHKLLTNVTPIFIFKTFNLFIEYHNYHDSGQRTSTQTQVLNCLNT